MLSLPATTGLPQALELLKNGAVIAHATETCYGLACDLTNPAAVAKLFTIKQRPLSQPISALFASVDQAKEYVVWNEQAQQLANQSLPGPLTLVLPLRPDAPHTLHVVAEGECKSVGVRVSSHPLAQQLVADFGSPLSTTSANLHGQPNPYSAEDILSQFAQANHQPDLILDSETLPEVPPSKVVSLLSSQQAVLREQS